ncbi:hypothetical protein CHU98_g5944 [Xylaria longipes]|nr:hypothetical protein CHU98_g5944 [Xylaria longipes]
MTIRGACSSSLIALNEACTSIARGEYESAIVGGTNIIEATSLTVASSKHGALSSDDSCKTFSSEANGYARGEGVVDELLRMTYFECHGTGTAVGDPVETAAVAKVLDGSGGVNGVNIGSVKPNLWHGEARPWPHDRYECESVNLLGIGGANVHVIVDSAARFTQTLVARISYMGPHGRALQITLVYVDVLASIGVQLAAMVGRSSGEIAAAYAAYTAGGLTAKEAITVAFYRGLMSKEQTQPRRIAAESLSYAA